MKLSYNKVILTFLSEFMKHLSRTMLVRLLLEIRIRYHDPSLISGVQPLHHVLPYFFFLMFQKHPPHPPFIFVDVPQLYSKKFHFSIHTDKSYTYNPNLLVFLDVLPRETLSLIANLFLCQDPKFYFSPDNGVS